MASKDLRVNLIVNAKTKELDKIFNRLNKMQTKLNQQATAQNTITRAVQKTNSAYKKSGSLIDGLTSKVHRLANAYLGVMAAKAVITTSDTITKAENKLNNFHATALGSAGYTTNSSGAEIYSQATLNATQQSMDKMYTSAQKVRMEYADMMSNVSKSMTLAGDAFGGNIDNAIRFQEIMSEAYTLSGASQAEMSSSMYQMIQGLGSGVLQGDELRSVREGASMAYKAIEEYAQGIYGADKNLKDLASDGLITSDIVVKAILSNGEKMDSAFANTKMTFEQAWTSMKNTAIKSFEPILQKINEFLNSENGQQFLAGINTAITVIAQIANVVFTIFSGVINWIVENWYWLKWIVLSVLIAITVYLLIMAGSAIVAGISAFMSFMMALSPMYLWILAIGLIIAVLAALGVSFSDVCGFIVGALFWLGATMWNIVVGVINAIIQFLYTGFVEPWIGIIEWVLNVFMGGFNSFGDAVKNLLGQIISWFLSLGKVVTKIIDAIFGTNWTAGLNSLQDKVLKWGKNENAITLSRETPVIQRVSAQDAFSTGYGYGEQFGNWTTDKVSGLKDKISGALNIGGLPNAGITPNLDDIASNTGGIDDNTGKMADSMQLAEEDLEYLRDVANMEWKKEFTTANITVDMTNNNTVSNDFDLNSLAIGLRELVEEEMYVVANGVYV